ncbi:MAG: polysaccharide deacetylase family protein [Actinomycetota bacterium]
MNPVLVAAKGKGAVNAARRAGAIGTHYGLGPRRMEERLSEVLRIVAPFGGVATLPITAAAVQRHPRVPARFAELGIEFAVHGYYHVDHIGLDAVVQDRHLAEARLLFESSGLPAVGFRAPYLRWNEGTVHALIENGFLYDSSQSMHWPIPPEMETDAYRRVLEFYGSLPAAEHPVLPRSENGLVRIPCCLPDDESVVDRLGLPSPEAIASLWVDVWRRTHERGELFTMQVHPERIGPCGPGVSAVLQAGADDADGVWLASLREIAEWWVARPSSTVEAAKDGEGMFRIRWSGPSGTTMLVRTDDPGLGEPWSASYRRVETEGFVVRAPSRPFIGVHPSSPEAMTTFLRAQGYVVERATDASTHTVHLHRERFGREDELALLSEIEAGREPLVRLGRWPNAARSAVAVTGDVDALTIWDYALRFAGR